MSTPADSQHFDSGFCPSVLGHRLAEEGSKGALLGVRLRRASLGVVATYASVAGVFIAVFSLVVALAENPATLIRLGVLTGFGFVALTSGLLHLLLRRTARLVESAFVETSQTQAARWSSDEAFRHLAENLEDVFWFGHPDKLDLHYVNPAYESIWGHSAESLRTNPTSWLATVHPDDRERLLSSFGSYATGNWRGTFRIVRPDGSTRWIDARLYMSRDAEGKPYRVAGISRDVTVCRNFEDQLRQAEKMEPIGRLAGGIAHDFNNLLSVILSYTGLLLAQFKPDDRGVAELSEIRRACERAAELTHQLLAFSRQQILRPQVLDLAEILRGMERMLSRLLREDIELELRLPAACTNVHADPSQIEQVVMNLAVNARDAMPAGGKLTIELCDSEIDGECAAKHPGAPPGRYVTLTVTDTGVGMDAGTRERLFQPFFTTKPKGKGTGLGLSTVFGIVKQSGGHLQVESEIGRGTVVKAYLPATNLVEDRAPQDRDMPTALIRGWETVLIVEDDEQVRGAARAILAHYGYRILEARDGVEASETCVRFAGEIHLLLTDTVMPGISGPALATQLAYARPSMKVLFMSGYTDNESIHDGVFAASLAFLAKPFTPDMLLRSVRKTLANANQA